MPPHFGLSKERKKKKKPDLGFTWFETAVNGGAVILNVLQGAANMAPVPYLRGAAATTLSIIQIAQAVKDNKADFRRLCEDAAALTVVVWESYQRSEDQDRWPGAGLKDAVDNFISTLNTVGEFAQKQKDRGRLVRVLNSGGDGNKIREFRERLHQALSRFGVTAHLQSYEILRLIKNMIEDHQKRLNEQAATALDESNHPLPPVPSYNDEEQVLRDEEIAKRLEAEERKAEEQEAEREARKKEQEAMDKKLQEIIRMLETRPEPEQSSKDRSGSERDSSSSDEEGILKIIMKDAADKRAARGSRGKDLDTILSGKLGGLNLNDRGGSSSYSGIPGRRGGGPVRVTNQSSGNVNSVTVYGSHNDNSTVTRINKATTER